MNFMRWKHVWSYHNGGIVWHAAATKTKTGRQATGICAGGCQGVGFASKPFLFCRTDARPSETCHDIRMLVLTAAAALYVCTKLHSALRAELRCSLYELQMTSCQCLRWMSEERSIASSRRWGSRFPLPRRVDRGFAQSYRCPDTSSMDASSQDRGRQCSGPRSSIVATSRSRWRLPRAVWQPTLG